MSDTGTPRSLKKHYLLMPLRALNTGLRKLAAKTHRLEWLATWWLSPGPEWFDHFGDQFYTTREQSNTFWMERGVFSRMVIKQGGSMLELCCGDGFNSRHFYSTKAGQVLAVDFDHGALWHARHFHSAGNIEHRFHDLRTGLPPGKFDNIVWDAAIEHFTEEEIDRILSGIKGQLTPEGILSGHTLVELETGEKHLHQHEREFKGIEDLKTFFKPHFKHVYVWETKHPRRHNLYFVCSQVPVPLCGN
ncbi:MAG: class I SAM-dependent methyltransferase [Alphaproteobacteria bacterium]